MFINVLICIKIHQHKLCTKFFYNILTIRHKYRDYQFTVTIFTSYFGKAKKPGEVKPAIPLPCFRKDQSVEGMMRLYNIGVRARSSGWLGQNDILWTSRTIAHMNHSGCDWIHQAHRRLNSP